ncbi:flagellin [Roseomonas sp. E05]|uniref:flagellin N-terminal helical domain-containing protein n=1 Tax=Roseomonas sp. E05 TaxID=3046310 RepID=UPI0024B96411|nr:flagellin [Roseomonas sp. E05]MDJ0390377.1 flagellin [Roseomonas sp. E05]
MVSSILTNNGAMTALQSLKATQKNLLDTQNRISTGLKVGTAKDNAATWAVATSMRSDIANFKQVSENLSVSSGVVKTASTGTEQIADLISKIREQVTSVQDGVKDAATVQATIDEYVGQIRGIVDSASYKGVNLINNSQSGNTQILASVNADGDALTPAYISVSAQNLTMDDSGLLAGLASLTVEDRVAKYSYGAPSVTGTFDNGDKLSFTFSVNGTERTAEWTAAGTESGAQALASLAAEINETAGTGNGSIASIVNGKLVVDAGAATDVVTFDGDTALAVAYDANNDITLATPVDENPPKPKYSFALPATAPTASDVYSFTFKVAGEDVEATYTVKNNDSAADVITGLKNAINQAAGTGNKIASVNADGKLVVDAAVATNEVEFDGDYALSRITATGTAVTPTTSGSFTYAVPTAGTAAAGETLSFAFTVNGASVTATTAAAAGGETPLAMMTALANEINDRADGVDDGNNAAGIVATVDGSGNLTINAADATGGYNVVLGGALGDLTQAGGAGLTLSAVAPTDNTATDNLYRQKFGFPISNATNDVYEFAFSVAGVAKTAKVTVEAGQTRAEVMGALANAINEEAGSTIASVLDESGTAFLFVDAEDSTTGTVQYTAASALTYSTHAENVSTPTELTPASSTDYSDLLATLKTAENAVLSAGAAFGAAQTRIDLQKDFMDKLVDTLTSGVGALVDADMSEEAARLQALQVQEQLGTQALSIANQAPQSILSLFRG